jgi:hypothetical protein
LPPPVPGTCSVIGVVLSLGHSPALEARPSSQDSAVTTAAIDGAADPYDSHGAETTNSVNCETLSPVRFTRLNHKKTPTAQIHSFDSVLTPNAKTSRSLSYNPEITKCGTSITARRKRFSKSAFTAVTTATFRNQTKMIELYSIVVQYDIIQDRSKDPRPN